MPYPYVLILQFEAEHYSSNSMWLWRWNLMKIEVEEKWRREKHVVDEKIYLFLGLETGMEYYKKG